jgi:hypothetical protein
VFLATSYKTSRLQVSIASLVGWRSVLSPLLPVPTAATFSTPARIGPFWSKLYTLIEESATVPLTLATVVRPAESILPTRPPFLNFPEIQTCPFPALSRIAHLCSPPMSCLASELERKLWRPLQCCQRSSTNPSSNLILLTPQNHLISTLLSFHPSIPAACQIYPNTASQTKDLVSRH